MLPGKNFGKLDSLKRHILHSLDRTQLIYTCILSSFSHSLVIDDSRTEVQKIHDSQVLKQRFMILTCLFMIHDSASTPDILVNILKGEFMHKNYASSCLPSGELKLFVIVSFLLFVYFYGAAGVMVCLFGFWLRELRIKSTGVNDSRHSTA